MIGFRDLFFIFGFMSISLPIVLLLGFTECVIGRPLAPPAAEAEEAQNQAAAAAKANGPKEVDAVWDRWDPQVRVGLEKS